MTAEISSLPSLEQVIAEVVQRALASLPPPEPKAHEPAVRVRAARRSSAPATSPAADEVRAPASDPLLDRILAELQACFDGRPVTPDRLGALLQIDREIADAGLALLVKRRQAKAFWTRGRASYLPVAPRPPQPPQPPQ